MKCAVTVTHKVFLLTRFVCWCIRMHAVGSGTQNTPIYSSRGLYRPSGTHASRLTKKRAPNEKRSSECSAKTTLRQRT